MSPGSASRLDRDERVKAFMDRLVELGLKPQAETLARAYVAGDVAVVFFEVGAWAQSAARAHGWNGQDGATWITKTRAMKLADALERSHPGDHAGTSWLRSRERGRIFVVTGNGTVMLNGVPEAGGYVIAPGTFAAREWMS